MELGLESVVSVFQVEGQYASAEPYGSGHINQTFWVKLKKPDAPSYILQKINHRIFKKIPELMNNICRVTAHLRSKIEDLGGNPDRETLTVILTQTGKPFYYDEDKGEYWRMYLFVENTRSYDLVTSMQQAFEGGKAFGRFQGFLDDLPGGPLFETIPNFHNIDARMMAFEAAVKSDVCDRAKTLLAERDFIESRYAACREVLLLGERDKIPSRVTHNDTKFNNVLLDLSDRALCVIDLDTVMPGYIHYDFSDAIRTGTNTAAEDEKDLAKIDVNLTLLESYAKGFLGEVGSKLTRAEWASLGSSVKLLPFMIGLRFLTDYLVGDVYFKTKFEGHNLQRARAQFQLTRCIQSKEDHILRLVASLEKTHGRI